MGLEGLGNGKELLLIGVLLVIVGTAFCWPVTIIGVLLLIVGAMRWNSGTDPNAPFGWLFGQQQGTAPYGQPQYYPPPAQPQYPPPTAPPQYQPPAAQPQYTPASPPMAEAPPQAQPAPAPFPAPAAQAAAPAAKFCTQCGAPLSDLGMYCPVCGSRR